MSLAPIESVTINQRWWRENWHQDRRPGQGCHKMGSPRRSGKGLHKTGATEGSKTQKRKVNKARHTPFRK